MKAANAEQAIGVTIEYRQSLGVESRPYAVPTRARFDPVRRRVAESASLTHVIVSVVSEREGLPSVVYRPSSGSLAGSHGTVAVGWVALEVGWPRLPRDGDGRRLLDDPFRCRYNR
ncbi:hypothetical protein JCM9743_06620 [Natrinema sp. JCM 9743]